MILDNVIIDNKNIKIYTLNTVIVGSGAAGLNAADELYKWGQTDICIVTEGINCGTSRNTGSDKQTYYKLSMESDENDSVRKMAQTLFDGGCMHGDTALTEAAGSAGSFFKLVHAGVNFPTNKYGEYVGYKTDHDPQKRATSVGPLTSKMMTEALEKYVFEKNIKIFDGYKVIEILSDDEKVHGIIAININYVDEIIIFNCKNVIFATGGPANIYKNSVYPISQNGCNGAAFKANVRGVNVIESQFGITSLKFRWNLSGSFQQVIPRYISTDMVGNDEKEFLNDYFPDMKSLANAIFLKGYQWPFDPKKIENYGSSLIDLAVFNEINVKNRRVFLDFNENLRYNNEEFQVNSYNLSENAYNYLKNSNLVDSESKPIERLEILNKKAIELYQDNNIDLYTEMLEIGVNPQHNNGGLICNIWYESNVRHFFPVGEAAGVFGIYRPGGSALNSTQVSSSRAAQYIAKKYFGDAENVDIFINKYKKNIKYHINIINNLDIIDNLSVHEEKIKNINKINEIKTNLQNNMNINGSVKRSLNRCVNGINYIKYVLNLIKDIKFYYQNVFDYYEIIEIARTQFVYLSAIQFYIENGGKSRGSYLICDENDKFLAYDGTMQDITIETSFNETEFSCTHEFVVCRPVPDENNWFENVWNDYNNDKIYD